MRLTCVLVGILALAATAAADEDARRIVERAVEAHGGKAAISKLRTMRLKTEGTIFPGLGQPEAPFKLDEIWHGPDRYKGTMYLDGRVAQIVVFNGGKVWAKNFGQLLDLCRDYTAEMREGNYVRGLERLGFLDDGKTQLTVLGETKVNGQRALGVMVRRKGHRNVDLLFHKASGLLVKRVAEGYSDSAGGMVVDEVVFSDHRETNGVKHHTKGNTTADGTKISEWRVTEIEFLEKIDDGIFVEP
jgi:hypothetical protein